MNTKILGDAGEKLAIDYLKEAGYIILAEKYRIRFGEIDLIAIHRDCLCFIEVKTRRSYDTPQEAVSRWKQYKLTRVAQHYLKEHYDTVDISARFDVVAIEEDANGHYQIQLIENAFEAAC